MSEARLREISIEMCRLLDDQSRVLNDRLKLNDISGEEMNRYARRAERLHQLAKELGALV